MPDSVFYAPKGPAVRPRRAPSRGGGEALQEPHLLPVLLPEQGPCGGDGPAAVAGEIGQGGVLHRRRLRQAVLGLEGHHLHPLGGPGGLGGEQGGIEDEDPVL